MRELHAALPATDLFAKDDETAAKARDALVKTLNPYATIVIHFTARSGSSWLTSAMSNAGLGLANEVYNPGFLGDFSRYIGARNLTEFVDLIPRFVVRQDVFSFEITSHHLKAVFADPGDFFASYSDATHFWLIREDIIEQAVSLHKMVSTGLSHSDRGTDDEHQRKDQAYSYDAEGIMHWLMHLHMSETLSEKYFQDYGITPVRMSYEGMMASGEAAVLNRFRQASGLAPGAAGGAAPTAQSDLSKMGTSKNVEFAKRFRAEYGHILGPIDKERAPRLEMLQPFDSVS